MRMKFQFIRKGSTFTRHYPGDQDRVDTTKADWIVLAALPQYDPDFGWSRTLIHCLSGDGLEVRGSMLVNGEWLSTLPVVEADFHV